MSEASGGGERSGVVPKELASLVPGFDPSVDNVEIWTSKVELLLNTWPTDKLNELATRLILNSLSKVTATSFRSFDWN